MRRAGDIHTVAGGKVSGVVAPSTTHTPLSPRETPHRSHFAAWSNPDDEVLGGTAPLFGGPDPNRVPERGGKGGRVESNFRLCLSIWASEYKKGHDVKKPVGGRQ